MVRKNETIVESASEGTMHLVAGNVTGTQTLGVKVDRSVSVESLARSVASRMALPGNVEWALRDERSSAYLRDGESIGTQLEPGARVTLTPKTHLG